MTYREKVEELLSLINRNCHSYIQGTKAFDFEHNHYIQKADKDIGSYEEMIKFFINEEVKPGSIDLKDVMVIIGGMGSGKTSALNHIVSHSNGIESLLFDFTDWEEHGANENATESDRKKDEDEFWNKIQAKTKSINQEKFKSTPNSEVKNFWEWAITKANIRERNISFNKLISQAEMVLYKEEITQIEINSLLSLKSKWLETSTPEDMAWYEIFLLKYSREISPTKICVLIDNIDHTNPDIQKFAVEKAVLLSDILKSKAIVTVRPLTWKKCKNGYKSIRKEFHYSAHIEDIIKSEFDKYLLENTVDEKFKKFITNFKSQFSSDSNHPLGLRLLIRNCSGTSIRNGLRIISNFLISPTISNLYNNNVTPKIEQLMPSEIYRAVFFGDEQGIMESYFENLYKVNGNSQKKYRLIKPRILDYISKHPNQGKVRYSELLSIISDFGHDEDVIRNAISELLERQRPLIWSDDGYLPSTMSPSATLMITPIGGSYLQYLFGEYAYIEVCFCRDNSDRIPATKIQEIDQEIFEQDQNEIRSFIFKRTAKEFINNYESADLNLSYTHWKKISYGLRKRIQTYDPKRENWISRKITELVGYT